MKKRIIAAVLAGMLIVSAGGCGNGTASSGNAVDNSNGMATESSADQAIASARQDENADADTKEGGVTALSLMQEVNTGDEQIIDDNYRTWYEVFVYSFFDSDGDGIGDLNGLTEKLDYINDGDPATDTDLGCNGIWLMPVMPSTTYHKYDVTDYCDIDPEYGTMDDFKNLIAACHERGINVIIDLVMNHTSSQHEWFKTAADYLKNLPEGAEPDASECPYVDYYNFSKEMQGGYSKLDGTDWYYEAQFWSEMPDLNLGSQAVRDEFDKIVDFWLDLGVDGFRLDAAKEYYSGSVDKNVEVLKRILENVHKSFKARTASDKARKGVMKQLLDVDTKSKLAACSSKKSEECEIYIVEGDSAGGTVKTARNRRTQAVLPLRGKILNVEKAPLEKILVNNEIKTMIAAFGCGIGENFDIKKLRYDKIIILTDADVDGAHISTLLLTFFYRFMPELIYQGKVYRGLPPLYRVSYEDKKGKKKNKVSEYLFNDFELEKFRKTGKKILELQRYKGLGEMDDTQLWETTLDPESRILAQVSISDTVEADEVTDILMGSNVPPRRQFIMDEAKYANLDI